MKPKKITAMHVTSVALLAALVFAASYMSIPLVYDARIHLGNVFCLLSGFVLGPFFGGLAAGIGSFFFDLTNPIYASTAPFTLVFKFMLAFVCGLVSWSRGRKAGNVKANIIAAIAGTLTYMLLYLGRNVIMDIYFLQLEMATVGVSFFTRLGSSALNGAIAVAVSVPLWSALRAALVRLGIYERLN